MYSYQEAGRQCSYLIIRLCDSVWQYCRLCSVTAQRVWYLYPTHTCTFYTCPLLWLLGYGTESKATVSELGVFNLLQSLRACASAHVIHHVDQNMPQTNGASAFCGASTLRSLVSEASGRGWSPSDCPEERWPRNYTTVDIRHLNWPLCS